MIYDPSGLESTSQDFIVKQVTLVYVENDKISGDSNKHCYNSFHFNSIHTW